MQQSITYSSSHEFYLALCLLLPLLSFVVSFLISDRYAWAISFTSPFFQLLSTLCAFVIFYRLSVAAYTINISWFHLGDYKFSADLQINSLSVVMLPVVSLISFLVHLYSTGYMAGNSGNRKYFAMLSFFTFSMLGIILANDLLLLFVFWELVGFSSYMLIGHWNDDPQAATAAKKAFIFNRIGDAGFLIGLMILWTNVGSLDISYILSTEGGTWKTAASLCIFCGVMGKSAQFPLSNWLPDAMIGPTPVSALIHAATMVAAGVFLLARLAPLFTIDSLDVIAIVGILTALLAALSALAQTDIKKILAYSTISQLGLMVTAVGAGAPDAAMLHLITHACFKACLFLSAGSVIHVLHQAQHQSAKHFDVQDIRNLGGLRKKLPFTFAAFVVSGGALAGLPFFSGFLSKDAMLSAVWAWTQDGSSWKWTILVAAFIVSFITVIYTFRLIWFVFMGNEKATNNISLMEAPMVMRMPLALLMIMSTWLIVSWNPFDFTGWLYNQFDTGKNFHFNFMAFISAGWVILALLIAYMIYKPATSPKPNNVLHQAFYLDTFYNWLIGKSSITLANTSQKIDTKIIDGALHSFTYITVTTAHLIAWIDKAVVDGAVHAVAATARGIGVFTRSFQGGKIQLYIFWAALGLIIFLIWILV